MAAPNRLATAAALLLLAAAARAEDPAARTAVENYFSAPTDAARTVALQTLDSIPLAELARMVDTRPQWASVGPGVYYINQTLGPTPVRYFLGVPPAYTPAQALPLVVMLPSPDPFLAVPAPAPDRVQAIYTQWITDQLTAHPDAAVLMPLLNLDELYGPGPAGVDSVIAPLRHVMGKIHVDPARVYLLGHSTGAHAAWNLGLHFPTYFAAIAPLAGAASADWQRLRQLDLLNVGVVVWQDLDDPIVKPNPTREFIASLKRLRIDVDYLQTRALGHTPTPAVVADRYAALRKRVKNLYPRRVIVQTNRPEPQYSRVEWLQITNVLNPISTRRLLPKHGSGYITVYTNPAKADAAINPSANAINIITTNVASLRLILSRELIDLDHPVTITVNRRPRFSAILHPSAKALLENARLLGRGWRTYPVTLDLDLTQPPPAPITPPPPAASPSP